MRRGAWRALARRGRWVAGIVVAATAAAGPATAASTAPWPETTPRTDGQSTAVWMNADQQVHVWRDGAAAAAVVATAATGCAAFPAVGAGLVAFLCEQDAPTGVPTWSPQFLNLADGDWRGVSDRGPLAYDTRSDQAYPAMAGVGRAAFAVSIGNPDGTYERRYAIQSGRLLPELTTRQVPDLDAVGGRTTMCAPLRVRRNRVPGKVGYHLVRIPATYRPPYLVTWNPRTRSVALARCGTMRQRRIGRSSVPAVFTDRYIAWASADTVVVRMNRTRATRRFRAADGVSGLVGTRQRLWVNTSGRDGQTRSFVIDLG